VHNDGKMLRVAMRQVEFAGSDFDSLHAVDGPEAAESAGFVLCGDALCSCAIDCILPLPVATTGDAEQCDLLVQLVLGKPRPKPIGGIDRVDLRLTLTLGGRQIESSGKSGLFEVELLDIQQQLPPGRHLRGCITCAFSDYNPAGQGLFGSLACFRGNKSQYLVVKDKQDLFAIWDSMTEFVQETYLCPEFQRRPPGTGYRG
jgi:hypothetical protein